MTNLRSYARVNTNTSLSRCLLTSLGYLFLSIITLFLGDGHDPISVVTIKSFLLIVGLSNDARQSLISDVACQCFDAIDCVSGCLPNDNIVIIWRSCVR